MLKALFPIESFHLGAGHSETRGALLRQARVGHPSFFGRYFHLCIPQDDIPQADLLKLVAAIGDPPQFRQLLEEFDKQGLAWEALKRLEAHKDKFKVADAEAVAVVLCDVADAMVGNYVDCGWTDFAAMSCLVIGSHLDMQPTSGGRFRVLKEVFEGTNGIYLPAKLLTVEAEREGQYTRKEQQRGASRDERRVLTRKQLAELSQLCIQAFERAAASDGLRCHSRLKEILNWWLRWSTPSDAAKVYFRSLVSSDDGLALLLRQYLGGRLREDGHWDLVDTLYDSALADLEQFMPADEINRRVEEFSSKQVAEAHSRLCSVFMEQYQEHVRNRGMLPGAAPEPSRSATGTEDLAASSPCDDDDASPPFPVQ